MITSALITALEKAQTPRAFAAASWALEKWTGVSPRQLSAKSSVSFDFSGWSQAGEWYRQNGWYRVGAYPSGRMSYSGTVVTPEVALETAATLAVVKVISEDMGALPFHMYRRNRTRDSTQKSYDHPLYEILHDLPNPFSNAGSFVESMTSHALLMGAGYAKIERSKRTNTVASLYPMTNGEVTRDRDKSGTPFFIYKDGNSAEKKLDFEEVFDLPGWSLDGTAGDSMMQRAAHVLGLTASAQKYAAGFFKNDASPGLILTRKEGLPAMDDTQVSAFKKAWREWHQGIGRVHEPAFLQDGMTASRLDPDHGKLQLNEQRIFQVTENCRITRVPPHKVAELSHATFSNIEEQDIAYGQDVLSPWSKRWRQTVYRCLLTKDERAQGYFAEHDVQAYQKGRFLEQATGWAKLLEKGVLSINDVLRWLNMNPVEGGDARHIQLNMQSITDAATGAAVAEGAKLIGVGETKLALQ